MDQKKQGGANPWVIGGVAVCLAYVLGFNQGEQSAAEPPPIEFVAAPYTETVVEPDIVEPIAADPEPVEIAEAEPPDDLWTFEEPDEYAEVDYEPGPAVQNPPIAAETEANDVAAIAALAAAPALVSRALPPTTNYVAPAAATTAAPVARIGCAENGTCYGDLSTATGRPKTSYVSGYTRKDGTYVRGHYRSSRRR